MNTKSFPSGPFATNAYVVSCPTTHLAAIIDPAPKSAPQILEHLAKHKLTADKIILTHSHWDHIADCATLKKELQIPIYIHPLDAPNLIQPGADLLPFWIDIEGIQPDKYMEEGEHIPVGNLELIVIHTPGHTPGGVCLYDKESHILLSGDTLFKGTIGNLSFPTCQPDLMWPSLAKLADLPPQTQVLPGHGPTTTIGNEPWLNQAEKIFGN